MHKLIYNASYKVSSYISIFKVASVFNGAIAIAQAMYGVESTEV